MKRLGTFLAFSDYQDYDTRDEFKEDQINISTKKIEVLQLEVKSVVIESS